MDNRLIQYIHRNKYELLFFALLQHLFIGIFLRDMPFYSRVVWPINMLILGIASLGVFLGKSRWKMVVRNILFLLVLGFPLSLPFARHIPDFMLALNIAYVLFFIFIFWEVLLFLIRPGYINKDVISASACGYLLMLEISVFLMQYFLYAYPSSFNGVDTESPETVFTDMVYFCSITLTSIGFGDITPIAHFTRLATALVGIAGQFYTVVLVGIIISKFTAVSGSEQKKQKN